MNMEFLGKWEVWFAFFATICALPGFWAVKIIKGKPRLTAPAGQYKAYHIFWSAIVLILSVIYFPYRYTLFLVEGSGAQGQVGFMMMVIFAIFIGLAIAEIFYFVSDFALGCTIWISYKTAPWRYKNARRRASIRRTKRAKKRIAMRYRQNNI